MQGAIWEFRWRWLVGRVAAEDQKFVAECVDLYSSEYGVWGPRARKAGERVHITPKQFRALVDDATVGIACAYDDTNLIGYCVAARSEIQGVGRVAWVSQLVVHSSYRQARVATRLLYSIWQFSDCHAWGLVTANPFAVRALETATRRPCRANLIVGDGSEILPAIAEHVTYVPDSLVVEKGREQPRVDTSFYVSHDAIPAMRKKAARGERPWDLGELEEGQEWFACTFRSQAPYMLGDSRLADLLSGADGIWLQAYEGMSLDEKHVWQRHTEKETKELLELVQVEPGARILDVGCGDGRHVEALHKLGYSVVGTEISRGLLSQARARSEAGPGLFELMDARKELPAAPFDLAICLYDVLGSSVTQGDDRLILLNIARALRPGGYLVASVMNAATTLPRLPPNHRPTTIGDFIVALESLSPSSTMEETGAVFNPDLIIHYGDAFYRKEQFRGDDEHLPAELLVRDHRFTLADMRELITSTGFEVVEIRPVQAGHWDRTPPLDATDPDAKELLILARRLTT